MATEIVEDIKTAGPGSDFLAQVQVHNDDSFPMDAVIRAFCEVLPACDPDRAISLMMDIHNNGVGTVWQGPREVCELYAEQLNARGLDAQVV